MDSGDEVSKPVKPMIEDRALQAILAQRRRSLERNAGETIRPARKGARRSGRGSLSKGGRPSKVAFTDDDNDDEELEESYSEEEDDQDIPEGADRDRLGDLSLDEREGRPRNKLAQKYFAQEIRHKKKLMGRLGAPGREEIYTDKARAAAVAMGTQDIKTSLKVKRKSERQVMLPDDMDSSVYLTESTKNMKTGNLETALECAERAVENSSNDPLCLVIRGRCHLLLGHLDEALNDAQSALNEDPSMVRALLVKAEALYGSGEFERSLVLFHRGARKRPDLVAFIKGIHKAREAILNAIGGGKFPGEDEIPTYLASRRASIAVTAMIATQLAESKPPSLHSSKTKEKLTSARNSADFPAIKPSKMASKRLLGGLSSDKQFLSSLVKRKNLSKKLTYVTTAGSNNILQTDTLLPEDEGTPIGQSGGHVAAVAQEALTSLQHLESFLWQRNPGELENNSKPRPMTSRELSRQLHRFRNGQNDKKSEIQSIKKKITHLLGQLSVQEGEKWRTALLQAERHISILRNLNGVHGGLSRLLCRLLIGVGSNLPKCDRSDDAVAVLSDAYHTAHSQGFEDEEHSASEWLGRVLASRGQHPEALVIWENRLPHTNSHQQRSSLYLLMARAYFESNKLDFGRESFEKSISEAEEARDSESCFNALVTWAASEVEHQNKKQAKDVLERTERYACSCGALCPDLLQEYKDLKNRVNDIRSI